MKLDGVFSGVAVSTSNATHSASGTDGDTPPPEQLPMVALADTVAAEHSADVLLFNADISRGSLELARQAMRIPKERRRENLIVILVTSGGDADAAFQIARLFRRQYGHVTTVVSGWCKSAGTLVVLGSNALVMFDEGELGPLDVQILRRDEIFELESGLTAQSAMESLASQAFSAFETFFIQTKLRGGGGISTRTATNVAVQLAVGLMSPLYAQIDPLHVGYAGRAMRIAEHYGKRLLTDSNLARDEGTLEALVSGYPSHGFAIDREEAETLFRNVSRPTQSMVELVTCLGEPARNTMPPSGPSFVLYLSTPQTHVSDESDSAGTAEGVGSADQGAHTSVGARSGQTEATPGPARVETGPADQGPEPNRPAAIPDLEVQDVTDAAPPPLPEHNS